MKIQFCTSQTKHFFNTLKNNCNYFFFVDCIGSSIYCILEIEVEYGHIVHIISKFHTKGCAIMKNTSSDKEAFRIFSLPNLSCLLPNIDWVHFQ